MVVMKLLLFSFFLKREEEDKEEEETLEMIALPLCLLRFVRVRALVAVALVGGGIDDDDDNNIFISLLPLFCFCVTFWHAGKRDSFLRNTRSRPKFSFLCFFCLFFCFFSEVIISEERKERKELSLGSLVFSFFFLRKIRVTKSTLFLAPSLKQ